MFEVEIYDILILSLLIGNCW